MKKYESITIGCAFSTKKSFNSRFQNILDEYSQKGWVLHSFHFDYGTVCTIVFEKDIDQKDDF